MKIAIVTDAIYPYNIGGKERHIYEISTRLAKEGHFTTIYTMKWWKGLESVRLENGVTLKAISPLYPLYSGNRRSIKEAIMFALRCFTLLFEDFDVIDVDHMPHLILFPLKIVCILKHKKMIVTWNEVWGKEYWRKYLGKLGAIAYLVERMSVLVPNEIISVSEDTTNKLRLILNVHQKIHTIPMGINLEEIKQIKPSEVRSDVIYTGRLLEHKNIDILLHAIKKLKKDHPDINCIIIGKGPEEQKLKRLANTLNILENVTFYGFLERHEDVYALIKSSRVFVFPSTREGFGIVVLEASACNIPVVTIDHKDNASRMLIKNGYNGLLIKLSVIEMCSAITTLLSQTKRTDLTKFVEKYSWDSIAKQVEEVIIR